MSNGLRLQTNSGPGRVTDMDFVPRDVAGRGFTPLLTALVDDVLTTGAHFKAAQGLLREQFPGMRIVELFIARRVPEAIEFEAVLNDLSE